MNRKFLPIVLLVSLFVACEPAQSEEDTLQYLAGQTCRAIALREQRFALANQIRFTLDSLMHPKDAADSARLSQNLVAFNLQKEQLLHESLTLADSIRTKMDSLSQSSLHDGASKKAFDAKLNNLLKQKGCLPL